MCTKSLQSCLTLCDSVDYIAHQAPLSMGFSSKNTGVGCHFLPQESFLTLGIRSFDPFQIPRARALQQEKLPP